MILDDIKEKLEEIDQRVYYGMVDDSIATSDWNYIVFSRVSVMSGANKREFSDRFRVAVIRENYIPDGMDAVVIGKMTEISGMRLANANILYTYTEKPSTGTVVEMMIAEFVRARKAAI